MFTEWMVTNKIDEMGKSLLYADFQSKFIEMEVKEECEINWQNNLCVSNCKRVVLLMPIA